MRSSIVCDKLRAIIVMIEIASHPDAGRDRRWVEGSRFGRDPISRPCPSPPEMRGAGGHRPRVGGSGLVSSCSSPNTIGAVLGSAVRGRSAP